ncbi:MAG: hypothetical protein L3J24_12050 [Xanthomonadales bacterium]|nr:hypothetical protein [Xanthomonadales bacterium]
MKTVALQGVVENIINKSPPPSWRFFAFNDYAREKSLTLEFEGRVVDIRAKGDVIIAVGDEIVVSGQQTSKSFVAWAYKNLTSGEEGGVFLRQSRISLLVVVVVSIILLTAIFAVYSRSFSDPYMLILAVVYPIFLICVLYEPLRILLARLKLRRFLRNKS